MAMGKPNDQELGRAAGRRPEHDLELWKHYASFGGEDKNRMVVIASWFLGFSAVILGTVDYHLDHLGRPTLDQPERAVPYAAAGVVVSLAAGFVALAYGGYANRNWHKADQIATAQKWNDLLPTATAAPPPEKGESSMTLMNRAAWSLSRPCEPDKKLAPVFKVFIGLATACLLLHLAILSWSVVTLR